MLNHHSMCGNEANFHHTFHSNDRGRFFYLNLIMLATSATVTLAHADMTRKATRQVLLANTTFNEGTMSSSDA